MKIWLVPSHHCINHEPWDNHGIRLTEEDIQHGISVWNPCPSRGASFGDRIQRRNDYTRSQNETSYNSALKALSQLAVTDDTIAVISFIWLSSVLSLAGPKAVLTTNRVWLGVYRRSDTLFTLPQPFEGQASCRSFLECAEGDDWERHFTELLVPQAA